MNGYIAFFEGRRIEIHAETMWGAVLEARRIFKPRKSKMFLINVALAEVDGKVVVHTADT